MKHPHRDGGDLPAGMGVEDNCSWKVPLHWAMRCESVVARVLPRSCQILVARIVPAVLHLPAEPRAAQWPPCKPVGAVSPPSMRSASLQHYYMLYRLLLQTVVPRPSTCTRMHHRLPCRTGTSTTLYTTLYGTAYCNISHVLPCIYIYEPYIYRIYTGTGTGMLERERERENACRVERAAPSFYTLISIEALTAPAPEAVP